MTEIEKARYLAVIQDGYDSIKKLGETLKEFPDKRPSKEEFEEWSVLIRGVGINLGKLGNHLQELSDELFQNNTL